MGQRERLFDEIQRRTGVASLRQLALQAGLPARTIQDAARSGGHLNPRTVFRILMALGVDEAGARLQTDGGRELAFTNLTWMVLGELPERRAAALLWSSATPTTNDARGGLGRVRAPSLARTPRAH